MTNIATAIDDIETWFDGAWAAGSYSNVPLHFSQDVIDDPNNEPWVHLSFLFGPTARTTFPPSRQEETTATLSIDVFAPKDEGSLATIGAITDEVRRIIRSGSITDVRILAPQGPNEIPEDNWLQWNISTTFYVDETL